MGNFAYGTNERLKRVILQDKLKNPTRLSNELKEEISFVLSRYLELKSKVLFKTNINEDGDIEINIYAKAGSVLKLN